MVCDESCDYCTRTSSVVLVELYCNSTGTGKEGYSTVNLVSVGTGRRNGTRTDLYEISSTKQKVTSQQNLPYLQVRVLKCTVI